MKINSIKKVSLAGSRCKGVASVILNNGNIVNDIRIIEGDSGSFIALPIPKKYSNKE